MVIVSHSDADHAGGALAILDELEVGQLVSSLWFDHPIARRAPRHARCMGGQAWQWDGVRFEMLHPTAASYDDPSHKPNARSCVLRVSTPGHALLLAGDIEAEQEAQLVAQQGDRLRSDVLLAPHHGSGTSSSEPFLAAVQPKAAIFQVGYRNRYRHPKPSVYARYGEAGILRWRTDETGALQLDSQSGFKVQAYRQQRARYWHGR
jgi:competence protein ComEC